MFNEAQISLNGYVATQPQLSETRTGIPSLYMRVAWTPRMLDRGTGEWKDVETSFLSVRVYRKTAENAATCLRKGDPVIVRGRFFVREFEDRNGARRTTVEVDATSIGHDLSRGVSQFQRVKPQTGMTALQYKATDGGEDPGAGGDEFASIAAGTGLDGQGGAMSAAEADELAGRGEAGAGDGGAFDEASVDALANEAATATAPF